MAHIKVESQALLRLTKVLGELLADLVGARHSMQGRDVSLAEHDQLL